MVRGGSLSHILHHFLHAAHPSIPLPATLSSLLPRCVLQQALGALHSCREAVGRSASSTACRPPPLVPTCNRNTSRTAHPRGTCAISSNAWMSFQSTAPRSASRSNEEWHPSNEVYVPGSLSVGLVYPLVKFDHAKILC